MIRGSLVLALLIPAQAVAAMSCPGDDLLRPKYTPQFLQQNCNKLQTECLDTMNAIVKASLELNSLIKTACDRIPELDKQIKDAAMLSAKDTYTQQINIYQEATREYNDIQKSLNKSAAEIRQTLLTPKGPLSIPTAQPTGSLSTTALTVMTEKKQLLSLITGPDTSALKSAKIEPADSLQSSREPTLFAGRNGTSYLQQIAKRQQEIKNEIDSLNTSVSRLTTSRNGLESPSNNRNNNTKGPTASSSDSGLDLKSLMGLATAGAGLMQAMKQNQSSASQDTATATSPTPNATNAAANGPAGPATSKFGDTKAPTAASVGAPAVPKDSSSHGRVPSGDSYRDTSDVNKSPDKSGASGFTPAMAKSVSGGGGPSGSEGEGPAAPRKEAAAEHASEDTQGINSGSLGGGGPASFGSGSSASAGAGADAGLPPDAGGVSDLFHDMKETAEGGGEPQADPADVAMADDDLFPRVRACYVRVLKAGRVIDGLGEKITPDSE